MEGDPAMSALETILARLLEAERTGDTETARRLRLVRARLELRAEGATPAPAGQRDLFAVPEPAGDGWTPPARRVRTNEREEEMTLWGPPIH